MSTLGPPLNDGDLLGLILVSPHSFRVDQGQIISGRLVKAFGAGLSFFRPKCREAEVRAVVARLTTAGAEAQTLVGAAVTECGSIRELGAPERFFCVYDTDAEEFAVHADVVGTWPQAASKNQVVKQRERRQKELRDVLQARLVAASDPDELIRKLNAEGFDLQS